MESGGDKWLPCKQSKKEETLEFIRKRGHFVDKKSCRFNPSAAGPPF